MLVLFSLVALLGCAGDNTAERQEDVRRAVTAADVEQRAFAFAEGTPFGINQALGRTTLTFGTRTESSLPFRLEAGGFAATGEVTFGSCDLHVRHSTFAVEQGPREGTLLRLQPCEIDPLTATLYVENDVTHSTATSAPSLSGAPVPTVNRPPIALSDLATTQEDMALELAVLTNDQDADGDPLQVVQVTPAAHGMVTVISGGLLHYVPEAHFAGIDRLTYTVSDGQGNMATAMVEVVVVAVNDPPVARADTAVTYEDVALTMHLLANDTDVDGEGEGLRVTEVTSGSHGTVVLHPDNTVQYTPAMDFHGSDGFTYTVEDGHGGMATARVDITVLSVNDAPVASATVATTVEDIPVQITVLTQSTDAEGDTLTVSHVAPTAQGGHVSIRPDGTLRYTPPRHFTGSDHFQYTVSDNQGGIAMATVRVTVTPAVSGLYPRAKTSANRATLGMADRALAIADLNADSVPDLVTFGPPVSVHVGRGDGTFGDPQTMTDGAVGGLGLVADLNADSLPDLITQQEVSRHDNAGFALRDIDIVVMVGEEDGTFTFRQTVTVLSEVVSEFPLPFSDIRDMVLADVDDNRHPDLITLSSFGEITVLYGRGDGTFTTPPAVVGNPGCVQSLVVTDLGADDRLDLVAVLAPGACPCTGFCQVPSPFIDGLAIFRGQGNGTFAAPQFMVLPGLTTAVQVSDVNADGLPDLVWHNAFVTEEDPDAGMVVQEGQADGTFGAPRQLAAADVRPGIVADLNADGRPDVVTREVSDDGLQVVAVLLLQADGTFMEAGPSMPGSPLAVVDINADTIPDLVLLEGDIPGQVSVRLGQGDGTFVVPPLLAVGEHPEAIAVAEVNGDGIPDLVTVNGLSGDASVLLGHGDGTFMPPRVVAVGETPGALTVADLNSDGRADLLITAGAQARVVVVLGQDDGAFSAPRTVLTGSMLAAAVADVNADGHPDVVVSNEQQLYVLLGHGDGTFTAPRSLDTGNRSFRRVVAVADVNADGHHDLLAGGSLSTEPLAVLFGRGDGTFMPPRVVAGDNFAASLIEVADVNVDGQLDIIALHAGVLSVLLGRGDGTFIHQQPAGVGSTGSPTALAVVDVNGDGAPDLITADSADVILVFLGRGDGTLRQAQPFQVGPSPGALVVADLNADRKPDVVTPHRSANGVSILLHR